MERMRKNYSIHEPAKRLQILPGRRMVRNSFMSSIVTTTRPISGRKIQHPLFMSCSWIIVRREGCRTRTGAVFSESSAVGGREESLWSVKADGSDLKQLKTTAERSFGPVVSPDGRSIAYEAWSPAGDQAWIMNIDGSDPRQVSSAGTDGFAYP